MRRFIASVILITTMILSSANALDIDYIEAYNLGKFEAAHTIYKECIENREEILITRVPDKHTRLDMQIIAATNLVNKASNRPIEVLSICKDGYTTIQEYTSDQPGYTSDEVECTYQQAKELAARIKEVYPGDEPRQVSALNQWICRQTVYDMSTYCGIGNSPYGVFGPGRAICEGYARAAGMVLDELGIPNILITSDPIEDETTHAYNLVYIGTWRYLDTTWNDTDGDINRYLLSKSPCQRYKKYNEVDIKLITSIKYPDLPLVGEMEHIYKELGIKAPLEFRGFTSRDLEVELKQLDEPSITSNTAEYIEQTSTKPGEIRTTLSISEILTKPADSSFTYGDMIQSLYAIYTKDIQSNPSKSLKKAMEWWNKQGICKIDDTQARITKKEASNLATMSFITLFPEKSGLFETEDARKRVYLLSSWRNITKPNEWLNLGDMSNILYNISKTMKLEE